MKMHVLKLYYLIKTKLKLQIFKKSLTVQMSVDQKCLLRNVIAEMSEQHRRKLQLRAVREGLE